ncbi:restriction endonuclease [Rhodococcus aetherivorans]|uniref:restriction endonuclease n=1 Tax=Rhodococcus aetherivorans TaxID=191292 RepID=UPI0036CA6EE4
MEIRSASDAERNAARIMRAIGFPDAHVTNAGPDGGIDVASHRAVAQVKWYGNAKVGRPDLQRLYGARGKRIDLRLFFFSSSGYSADAVAWANEHEVALFTFDDTGRASAVNYLAQSRYGTKLREEEGNPYGAVGDVFMVVAKFVGWLIIAGLFVGAIMSSCS